MIRALLVFAFLLSTPAIAEPLFSDDPLIELFTGGDPVELPEDEDPGESDDGDQFTRAPGYIDNPEFQAGEGDFDTPGYLEWYLSYLPQTHRPEGMTDREYAEWVDAGCPPAEDLACGQ